MTFLIERLRLAVVAVAAAAIVLGGADGASADSRLVESEPADGARLRMAPTELRLQFDEPVDDRFVTLTLRAAESPIERLQPQVDGGVVTAAFDERLVLTTERTTWVLSYRVVSADGHPIDGTVEFTVPALRQEGTEGMQPLEPPTASGDTVQAGVVEAPRSAGLSSALFVAGAIAAGGLLAAVLVLGARRRARRVAP